MNKAANYIPVILFAWLACSCNHELKGPEYVKYVQDTKNGLRKQVHTTTLDYQVFYKPYDYIIFQESQGSSINPTNPINPTDYNKRLATLKGTAWFNFSFKMTDGRVSPLRYGVSDLDEYNQRLDYYLNKAVNDIRLIYGADTLRPMSYEFETNYNLTPQETIVVGFDLKNNSLKPDKDLQFVYHDNVFQNGIIKALFPKNIFNNIPRLIY